MLRGEVRKGNALAFYDLRLQTIFNVLREMYEANLGIDVITVQERLKQRGVLDEIGGIPYLAQLEAAVPSAGQLPEYLRIIREKALVATDDGDPVRKASARIYEHEGDPEEFAALHRGGDVKADGRAGVRRQTEEHIKAVMGRGDHADMEQWHYARGSQQLRGLPTGPPGVYLDKILMGIRDTHYVTIAGRPGDGKSSLAMNIVEFLAKDYVWFEKTGRKVLNAEQGLKLTRRSSARAFRSRCSRSRWITNRWGAKGCCSGGRGWMRRSSTRALPRRAMWKSW